MAQLRRQSGSIVGRSPDIRAVRDALDHGRLVDLVGPGGVGKTALAAEVIHEIEPDFERVVLVELADAAEDDLGRLLAAAVLDDAAAPIDRVLLALSATPTLLVIDNCEHVVDEVARLVSDVLHATADVTILTTSRRPLEIAEEVVWTVGPLAVPTGYQSNRDLTSSEAVQLFLERVRQSVPTFELTDANRAMVAEICTAADGVPLVLELAAALVRGRPLDEILRAMTERPNDLAGSRRDRPEHQQSLAASLDWSRQFLTRSDARLLDRLSVFVGGFTYEAARHVSPDGSADGLVRLVDHSLVSFDPAGERYRMLEIVRIDANERLTSEELLAAERGHFEWCLLTVSRIEADKFDADPDNLFPRFECELPNLGTAARRSYERGDLDGFRSLVGPIAVWWVHYIAPENPERWEQAFDPSEVPPLWSANMISALSFYWSHRGRHDKALSYALASVQAHAEAGEPVAQALDEVAVGNAHLALDDPDQAKQAYERGLAVALRSGRPYPELAIRVSLARLDLAGAEGRAHLAAAQQLSPGFGAIEAAVTTELGLQALHDGRLADARRLCDEGLSQGREAGYPEILASNLSGRADVARVDGDNTLAYRLYSEALAIGRGSLHEGVIERATDGLQALPDHSDGSEPATEPGQVELSDRELSVARLLRGDLTQREIADELYIAPSTVKTHIKSIYRKLGVTKRSYAVTRASEIGLFDQP